MSELTTPWKFEVDGPSYSVEYLGTLTTPVMFYDCPHTELAPDIETAEYLTELHNLVLEYGGLEEVREQLKVVKRLQALTSLAQDFETDFAELKQQYADAAEDYKNGADGA